MQIDKVRVEPLLLTVLNILDKRMILTHEEKLAKLNMEKGYIGEEQFDQLMNDYLKNDYVVLQDLLLRVKGNSVQIDSLLLTPEVVYLYEIKNYEGDYVMKSGQIHTLTSHEISNPLTQLSRTASLLRQLFQSWNVKITIEAAIVFINPSLILYQADPVEPIIFSAQIKHHFSKISQSQLKSSGLSKRVIMLSEKLVQEHTSEVPFQKQLPQYEYDNLTKGMTCKSCGSFEMKVTQRTVGCSKCEQRVSTEEAILTHIKEFQLLFPDSKLTVTKMTDWFNGAVCRKRIRRTLVAHFERMSSSSGTYYK